jgi:hypothetical protein
VDPAGPPAQGRALGLLLTDGCVSYDFKQHRPPQLEVSAKHEIDLQCLGPALTPGGGSNVYGKRRVGIDGDGKPIYDSHNWKTTSEPAYLRAVQQLESLYPHFWEVLQQHPKLQKMALVKQTLLQKSQGYHRAAAGSSEAEG